MASDSFCEQQRKFRQTETLKTHVFATDDQQFDLSYVLKNTTTFDFLKNTCFCYRAFYRVETAQLNL